jgi:hypothetical protein
VDQQWRLWNGKESRPSNILCPRSSPSSLHGDRPRDLIGCLCTPPLRSSLSVRHKRAPPLSGSTHSSSPGRERERKNGTYVISSHVDCQLSAPGPTLHESNDLRGQIESRGEVAIFHAGLHYSMPGTRLFFGEVYLTMGWLKF